MNRIKMLREEKQMNMREVADALKIPYTTYVNYEKELREPNSEMLVSLANYFEGSIDYLIGRSDSRKNNLLNNELESNFNIKEKKLVDSYRSHPEMQSAVDKLLGIDTED